MLCDYWDLLYVLQKLFDQSTQTFSICGTVPVKSHRGTQTSCATCHIGCQTDLDQCDDGHDSSDEDDAGDELFYDDADDDPDWQETSDVDSSEGQANELDDGFELTSESSDYVHERKFVVFESCLVKLLLVCFVCLGSCRVFVKKVTGSFVALEQRCVNGHTLVWNSQSFYGSLPAGNLIAACILFSDLNPVRTLNVFRHFRMPTIALRTYNMMQSSYLTSAVKSVWISGQETLVQSLHGMVLHIGGDGRCCSPGHTAKFGSYSVMDLNT